MTSPNTGYNRMCTPSQTSVLICSNRRRHIVIIIIIIIIIIRKAKNIFFIYKLGFTLTALWQFVRYRCVSYTLQFHFHKQVGHIVVQPFEMLDIVR